MGEDWTIFISHAQASQCQRRWEHRLHKRTEHRLGGRWQPQGHEISNRYIITYGSPIKNLSTDVSAVKPPLVLAMSTFMRDADVAFCSGRASRFVSQCPSASTPEEHATKYKRGTSDTRPTSSRSMSVWTWKTRQPKLTYLPQNSRGEHRAHLRFEIPDNVSEEYDSTVEPGGVGKVQVTQTQNWWVGFGRAVGGCGGVGLVIADGPVLAVAIGE
jgi:hypothetical protein